ncbi:DJ-1/PfpI family protein [Sphingobacterium oryzagri]|uniref:DJ-1/PfpI family protein n=1 Tax=Sphingobacterium oryzagri TaxID=3025669 RepID=A0ABY7WL59_9SPHI|nr:DJ-1/PfpI family protein [Sphingobacterium sp. KACC 22765]WDF70337.1 DJ-1/PfpI family protein [Sphingobacterium sp. KACC 22765]
MFTIAMLISDGFDEWAVKGSKPFFKTHAYHVDLVSPKDGEFARSWSYKDWGPSYAIDKSIAKANPADYDALIMPGGALSIDNLRTNVETLAYIQHFIAAKKPIGTLCHGIWPLVELDYVRGKQVTCVHTIKTDIKNAQGNWVDQAVVQDQQLVTSRTSEDLEEFLSTFHALLTATLQDAN